MSKKKSTNDPKVRQLPPWRQKMHEIIFEADTFWGKTFDVTLLWAIILSVIVVMLDSVDSIQAEYGRELVVLEIIFTIFFTTEYIARLLSVGKPMKYVTSFFGVVDLLSILPFYISLFLAGPQYLLVIRTLRLLRVFRILKLARMLREAQVLGEALKSSRAKITVFMLFILTLVTILGTIMYLIEGASNPQFDSIPRSIYWAIVTLTTVGYGDISPITVPGQFIASMIMILGYSVIAVPTGIVSVEIAKSDAAANEADQISNTACPQCSEEGHAPDAEFCKYCGSKL